MASALLTAFLENELEMCPRRKMLSKTRSPEHVLKRLSVATVLTLKRNHCASFNVDCYNRLASKLPPTSKQHAATLAPCPAKNVLIDHCHFSAVCLIIVQAMGFYRDFIDTVLRITGRDGKLGVNSFQLNLPSPNVHPEAHDHERMFRRLSGKSEASEEEEEEVVQDEPPASALHRRRALVPPKVF